MSFNPLGLVGVQTPRVEFRPPAVSNAAAEAVELAASAGLILDPWQVIGLQNALGEDAAGRWSAFEVGVLCNRQNGKGAIIEARELAGLFLFGEEMLLHTAHVLGTAKEAFRRMRIRIESCPDLDRRVAQIRRSNEEVSIELLGGQRLRYLARQNNSGRGFTGDLLVFDEAMVLDAETIGATLPTLSARPNPQVWYVGSAALAGSTHWRNVRARALARTGSRLAWSEWSVEVPPDDLDDAALAEWAGDTDRWAQGNPALGRRITEEFLRSEHEAMSLAPKVFCREHLGVPDKPVVSGGEAVLNPDVWLSRTSGGHDPLRNGTRRTLAVEVEAGQTSSAVVAASMDDTGRVHIAVIDHRSGTAWLPERLAELHARYPIDGWGLDPKGQAGGEIPRFTDLGLPEPTLMTAGTMAQACGALAAASGALVDAAADGPPRVLVLADTAAPLTAAVAGARRRPLGDAWAWKRRDVSVAISPLVAATIAHWLVLQTPDHAGPTADQILASIH